MIGWTRLATAFVWAYDGFMRWVGIAFGVLGVLASVSVARAEPIRAPGAHAELPIGTAAFPVDGKGAPAPAAQLPAPAAAPLVPPPPVPAQMSPSPDPANAHSAPSVETVSPDCPRSSSTVELGAAAVAAMIRDGKGLFAVLGMFGYSDDEKVIDDAAEREVRRLRFVHRLAEMREQESEREFSEKLAGYLRKRAFLEGLEGHRQLAPSPFGAGPR